MTYHVLTEAAALELGIIDANGKELEHSATREQVEAAAELATDSRVEAHEAASNAHGDRWLVDDDGNSHYYHYRHGDRLAEQAIERQRGG